MSTEIQKILQKMRLTYIANLPQQLDTMEALALKLKMGEDYEHCYENLYRAVHSLRGTAGTYGIPVISTICQPFEDYLTTACRVSSGVSDEQTDACMGFIDLLRMVRDQLAAGMESFPEIEALLEAR